MLTKNQLVYVGAVRTPPESLAAVPPPAMDYLGFSNGPFTIDFARNQYVFGTKGSRAVRLQKTPPSFPRYRTGSDKPDCLDASSVPVAPWVDRVAVDPSNQTWQELNRNNNAGDGRLGGFAVVGDDAVHAGTIYYDANGEQDVSFFMSEWPLPGDGRKVERTPWAPVTGAAQGWAAGPMCLIPERFREALRGDIISGQSGLPIIMRQSFGCCALSWKVADLLKPGATAPVTVLVGYPGDHTTLGPWGGPPNDLFNMSTVIAGMAFIGDDLVFFGTHGYGEAKYGIGTSDPALVGLPIPGSLYGEHYDAYDPTSSAKGCHCYPYRRQGWSYPVADLIDVVQGRKKHYELIPTWFELTFPIFGHPEYRPDPNLPPGLPSVAVLGVAYDSLACELHVAAGSQDSIGWEPAPLIHTFKVSGVPSFPNPVVNVATVDVPPVIDPPPPPPVDPPVTDPQTRIDMLEALIVGLHAELAESEAKREGTVASLELAARVVETLTARVTASEGAAQRLADAKARVAAILVRIAKLKGYPGWLLTELHYISEKV